MRACSSFLIMLKFKKKMRVLIKKLLMMEMNENISDIESVAD